MTLDEAKEVFDVTPSDKTCADYLKTAAEYFKDSMILESTYTAIVERVAEWLADDT